MTDEELAELRAYKPAEVARMLNIPITRLETWVRKTRSPMRAPV
jgi:DNA-directed RNA polymerase specialized sigma24 family protein